MSAPFAPPGTPARWARSRRWSAIHVDLAVTLDPAVHAAAGTVRHRVRWIGAPEPEIRLDAHDLDIRAVRVDGVPVAFTVDADAVVVPVPAAGGEVELDFAVEAPRKGLHRSAPPGGAPMLWTQGAMEDHSWWFPCQDHPNNRCTWRIAVRHPAALQAVANGRRVERTDHGDGWVTTVHALDQATVIYLLNVAVGDLVGVEDPGPVPTTHWLARGDEGCAAAFRATAFAIDWLGGFLSTPYPWPRYGHVVAADFLWGGMENATLTTIARRAVADAATMERDGVDCDSLIIHELVHQWFGDHLTMKAWSDIWLNESFATWLEARCTAAWRHHREGVPAADDLAARLWDNRSAWHDEDATRYRRPLVTNRYQDPYELFDRTAYEKGSLVLEHLAQVVGEPAMRNALALYLSRHGGGLVETADWRQAVEDATGEPLDWFFAQWVERAGHPDIEVAWTLAGGRIRLGLTQRQDGEPFRVPTEIAWRDGAGVHRQRIELRTAAETVAIPFTGSVTWVALDPDGRLPAAISEKDAPLWLRQRLADPEAPAAARARAAAGLGRTAPVQETRAVLVAAATDGPDLVRRTAIAALGALDHPAARRALLDLAGSAVDPRLRRAAADALAVRIPDATEAAAVAGRLIALADGESSPVTAGSLLAARGAVDHPGATADLRSRSQRPSWQDRLRLGCLRGLGASGEAAAADDLLRVLASADPAPLRAAAADGLARLADRHPLLRSRVRQALGDRLADPLVPVRTAAAKALGRLADPADAAALRHAQGREVFGHAARTLREAVDACAAAGSAAAGQADLARRVADLEKDRDRLKARLDALESGGGR